MIIINTVNNERFSLNGIEYFKNFLSFVAGDKVAIYNAYDKSDQRIELATYSDFNLNGVVYGSASLLQAALINVIYTRDTLGAVNTVLQGSITPASVPTGTGVAFWVATQAGTYTNFGGVVVSANSFAVISRDKLGVFSISQTALNLTEYQKKVDGNKINTWTAKAYLSGDQVNYLGKDWVSNAATVSTDIPNTSSLWTVRLTSYENKAGLVPVKNMFNKATITVDKYVSDTNGLLITQSGLNASDFIPVLPSTNYYYSNSGSGFRAYYDANKNYISGVSQGYTTGTLVTTPANTYYIRVSLQTASINTAQLELGSVATSYSNYTLVLPENLVPTAIARKSDVPSLIDFTGYVKTTVLKNLFDKTAITTGKYVSGTNGTLTTLAGYNASDFIPILPSTNYYLSNSGNDYRAYYDVNKVYISGSQSGFTIGVLCSSPANAYYIRVSCTDAYINTAQLELGSVATVYNSYENSFPEIKIPSTIVRITDLNAINDSYGFVKTAIGKNIFDKSKVTAGKYVQGATGNLITLGGFNASEFIPVLPSTNYYLSNSGNGYRAYYDANKVYISGTEFGYTVGILYTTPANAYFIRVTCTDAFINTTQLELGSVATAYNFYEVALQGSKIPQEIARKTDLVSSKNIACFGDSITADVYPTNLLGLLGNGYNVVNNGCGSAWVQDISARFGGVPALLLNDLAIPAGTTPFVLSGINNKYQTGSFQIAPIYNLDRAQSAYSPLTIDNEDFNMVLTESGGVVTATLSRVTAGTAFTIKAGTKIHPASLTKWRNGYIPVFFMGTNNVAAYNFDLPTYTPTIINYHKDCLKLVESSNFLILGLFNISQRIYARDLIPSASPTNAEILAQYVAYEKQMTDEFGLNFIPLRKYLASRKAIDDAVKLGYMTSGTATTNTSNDDLWIGRGCAAYSFMEYAGGTDYTHPNSVGYKMIAWYVYNALKKLGV
jgi:lysophospholipase L1-like esterase